MTSPELPSSETPAAGALADSADSPSSEQTIASAVSPAATSPSGNAKKAATTRARKSARRPSRKKQQPPRKASQFIPHMLAGLALGGLHVWFDFPFQPVAIAGIALCVYAYVQMGSVNEIVPESDASAG